MPSKRIVLLIIVLSQFACTSLWFAGNAVMTNLLIDFQLAESALGHLTSAVQFGFICGTLTFAILSIADRYPPSWVFFISAFFGALFNLGIIWNGNSFESLLNLRFLTGFFLAGIYPVGMKIAADYFQKGLGKSLGFLVGALVLGTAFPHFLKASATTVPWRYVLMTTSALALLGGLLMVILIPNGPFREAGQKINFSASFIVFKNKKFRAAAFGYFGHMWELYAFWAFVPIILINYRQPSIDETLNTSYWAFIIIGVGSLACVLSGYISAFIGIKKTAAAALFLSLCCCLLSPFIFQNASNLVLILFLLFWGLVVIADSPLFSTLVAQNADPTIKGTALTIVNCIGFTITIFSIQLLNYLNVEFNSPYVYTVLSIGPLLGLIGLFGNKTAEEA